MVRSLLEYKTKPVIYLNYYMYYTLYIDHISDYLNNSDAGNNQRSSSYKQTHAKESHPQTRDLHAND